MIDVVNRWKKLYKGNMLVDRWMDEPAALDDEELKKVVECIEYWRSQLYDISRFMACINEKIARMSNKEEKRKGRFWDGRCIRSIPGAQPFGPAKAALIFSRKISQKPGTTRRNRITQLYGLY